MPVWFILILDIKHDNVHIFGHFNWTSGIFPFNVVVKPPIPVLIWPFLVSLGTVFILHEIIPILMKMHSHRTRFPSHYFLLKYILFFLEKSVIFICLSEECTHYHIKCLFFLILFFTIFFLHLLQLYMMQNHLSSTFLKDNPAGCEMYSDISPNKMYFVLNLAYKNFKEWEQAQTFHMVITSI